MSNDFELESFGGLAFVYFEVVESKTIVSWIGIIVQPEGCRPTIHICKMVQFPVSWTFFDMKARITLCGRYIFELKLNDEWTIACYCKENSCSYLKPHSVEFRRVKSTIEHVHISGTLYLSIINIGHHFPVENQFSRFLESGSSSIEINLNCENPAPFPASYHMHGVVNISAVSIFGNGECKKCVHMKSLIELSNDLERLLDPETCCLADVNFKCGDATIPAHKNILSARSPVFAAMFKNPMKENHQNEVVISDMDPSVLRATLAYVYTGKLSNLTVSSAFDLLPAAEKYLLGDLKRVCCDFLKDNISLQNALRILFLGDLHCSDLKSCAVSYICSKCTEFSVLEKTEEWENMRKERPDLAMDVLISLVKAKEKK